MNDLQNLEESPAWTRQVQELTLWELVRAAEGTAFGRSRGLSSIETANDFQARVPLVSEADLLAEPQHCLAGPLVPASATGLKQLRAVSRLVAPRLHAEIQAEHWFDLRARFASRQRGQATVESSAFGAWLDEMTRLVVATPSSVVMGPTHWLCGMIGRIAETGSAASTGSIGYRQAPLRALLATADRVELAVDLLQIQARRVAPSVVVLAGYEAVPGALLGLRLHQHCPEFTLMPDAGHFMEFVALSGKPEEHRVPLWEVRVGCTYEVCLSTGDGLFGYRSGHFVRFTGSSPYRFVPVERDPFGDTTPRVARQTVDAAFEPTSHGVLPLHGPARRLNRFQC